MYPGAFQSIDLANVRKMFATTQTKKGNRDKRKGGE